MIKKILMLLLLSSSLSAQICKSNVLQVDYAEEAKLSQIMAGSCASPDGPNKLIGSPPPSYNYLQNNGYCYTLSPATRTFQACYTFTSTSTTATFNAGYSSTGCAGISFSGFNLYTCNPACTFVGSGLTFSGLTIGQCYTWCFSGNCIGGPGPGFTSICPYYMQNIPLPIELLEFKVEQEWYGLNRLLWKTSLERNSSHFEILRSNNAIDYQLMGKVSSYRESNSIKQYEFIDDKPISGLNYYKINHYDIDGKLTYISNIMVASNYYQSQKPTVIYNTLGEEVNMNYEGLKMLLFSDGTIIKEY